MGLIALVSTFWHVPIPRKNSAFLHDLEAYHELEGIQISFAEALSKAILLLQGCKRTDLLMRRRKHTVVMDMMKTRN